MLQKAVSTKCFMVKTNFYELLRLINRNGHRSFAISDIVKEK